jgi:hypothetical protein
MNKQKIEKKKYDVEVLDKKHTLYSVKIKNNMEDIIHSFGENHITSVSNVWGTGLDKENFYSIKEKLLYIPEKGWFLLKNCSRKDYKKGIDKLVEQTLSYLRENAHLPSNNKDVLCLGERKSIELCEECKEHDGCVKHIDYLDQVKYRKFEDQEISGYLGIEYLREQNFPESHSYCHFYLLLPYINPKKPELFDLTINKDYHLSQKSVRKWGNGGWADTWTAHENVDSNYNYLSIRKPTHIIFEYCPEIPKIVKQNLKEKTK